jgi:hypothetical protein
VRPARLSPAQPFPEHGPAFLHVTEDPERDLALLAPHLVHASNLYAQWAGERGASAANGYWAAQEGTDSLRADPTMWVLTPAELLERCQALPRDYELRLHPLLGGIPPELSWRSLELLADRVLPALGPS